MNILFSIVSVYLFLWNLVKAFVIPKMISNFECSFILNDLEYIVANKRVTWDEAEIGCSTTSLSSLAVIDTMEKAKFLSIALGETDLIVENLWAGANLQDCNDSRCGTTCAEKTHCDCNKKCFKWLTGDVVNTTLMIDRFKEKSLVSRECLSFGRNYHKEPIFVDLQCILKRPYICQRPFEQEEGEMTHRGWIKIDNYEYAIFYGQKTWNEAVRECFTKHKAHLADFRNMKEVAEIGKYLLIGRPSMENAWFGGYYRKENWSYISSGKIIVNNKNKVTLYPPWASDNESIPNHGCLMLDRHLNDGRHLTFIQAGCFRKKSYICSRQITEIEELPFETIIIDDICYTLYYSAKTWNEAKETCEKQNAWLVEVTKNKIDHILYIMGENRTEINHIWIGGRLKKDNKWEWIHTKDAIESDKENIFNGYPPWLVNTFDQQYSCLNLDRENHNRPIFYGVYCQVKQAFICEKYDFENCSTISTDLPENLSTTTFKPKTTEYPDIWKWKWPSETYQYNKLKPFFNWSHVKQNE